MAGRAPYLPVEFVPLTAGAVSLACPHQGSWAEVMGSFAHAGEYADSWTARWSEQRPPLRSAQFGRQPRFAWVAHCRRSVVHVQGRGIYDLTAGLPVYQAGLTLAWHLANWLGPLRESSSQRRDMKKIGAELVAALGLLVFIAPAALASTPAWAVMQVPGSVGPQQSVSCWATGGCLSAGNGQAMEWKRHAWTAVPVPADSVVSAVSCLSATYCIGVGNVNREGAAAWSWNGKAWTSQPAYSPGTAGAGLVAVSCASRRSCEAVGSSDATGAGGSQAPLAEIWNGRTWTDQPISGAPASGWLDGLACESAGTCEAVGNSLAYTCISGVCVIPPVAWAAGLSGSGWVAQPSLSALYPEASDASSVSCLPSGCTAVGREGSAIGPSNPGYTFAAHWNGAAWSQQGAIGSGQPSGSYFASWSGVHCASASRCTAVGAYEPSYGGPSLTLVSTWSRGTWSQAAAPGSAGSFLAGLSCAHGGFTCTAVGGQSSAALALRN